MGVASVNHFQTLTSPVPSPVKNKPPGPICMDRTSCFEYILPLSKKLNQNKINTFRLIKEKTQEFSTKMLSMSLRWQVVDTDRIIITGAQ